MNTPVVVDLDGPLGETWRQCADVLVGSRRRSPFEAVRLARRVLRDYPGCALAVVRAEDEACVALRGADRGFRLRLDGAEPSPVAVVSAASALCAELSAELLGGPAARLSRPAVAGGPGVWPRRLR